MTANDLKQSKFITEQNYKSFKKLYEKAVREKKEIFIFEGDKIVTAFGKYLIEYVEIGNTKAKINHIIKK